MTTQVQAAGSANGMPLYLITLRAGNLTARVYNAGCSMTELWVPDRNGNAADVILGFDSGSRYLEPHPYYGSLIGRVANRISNGRFLLDGVQHDVGANEPSGAHLHGGAEGFHAQVWDFDLDEQPDYAAIRFHRRSPAGEGGYPGALSVEYEIRLTASDEVIYYYGATADAPTPFSPTNHCYYNLAGHQSGTIAGHWLTIDADHVLATDGAACATGELTPVAGTPKDFRQEQWLLERICQNAHEGSSIRHGYDNTYVLNSAERDEAGLRPAAVLRDPASGRVMSIATDMPVLHFFDHGSVDHVVGKCGAHYGRFAGLCLETHLHPNFPNVPAFGRQPLRPGERFSSTTKHTFTVC